MRKLTDIQVTDVCERYQSGESSEALAKEFGLVGASVRGLLNRRGIARRSRSECNRQYYCDHDFFDVVDNEEKAYWLGFIAADGNIDSRNMLVVTLATQDIEHLQKLAKALNSTHPVQRYDYGTKRPPFVRLLISSPQIVSALGRYGVTPKKTFTLRFPDLPEHLLRHFVRGYFDGDGGFNIGKAVPSNIVCSVTSNEPFLEECQKFLMLHCGLSKTKLYRRHPKVPIAALRYSGGLQVARIVSLLYSDALIYLPRKYEKISAFYAS